MVELLWASSRKIQRCDIDINQFLPFRYKCRIVTTQLRIFIFGLQIYIHLYTHTQVERIPPKADISIIYINGDWCDHETHCANWGKCKCRGLCARPLTMFFFWGREPFGKRLNQTLLNIVHRVPHASQLSYSEWRMFRIGTFLFFRPQCETEL